MKWTICNWEFGGGVKKFGFYAFLGHSETTEWGKNMSFARDISSNHHFDPLLIFSFDVFAYIVLEDSNFGGKWNFLCVADGFFRPR